MAVAITRAAGLSIDPELNVLSRTEGCVSVAVHEVVTRRAEIDEDPVFVFEEPFRLNHRVVSWGVHQPFCTGSRGLPNVCGEHAAGVQRVGDAVEVELNLCHARVREGFAVSGSRGVRVDEQEQDTHKAFKLHGDVVREN